MEYIENGKYEIKIGDQTVVASAEELRDAFLSIKKYEGSEVNDYVETCPTQYVYENSARFEILETEIRDSGWENLEWSDELGSALDVAMECAMTEARDYYKHYFLMEKKI